MSTKTTSINKIYGNPRGFGLPGFQQFGSKLDMPLVIAIIACLLISIAVIYSAKMSVYIVIRQLLSFVAAFMVMCIAAQLEPRTYSRLAPIFYFTVLAVLIAVLLAGDISKGARRWLDLGVLRFQPAELMKLALPMMVASSVQDAVLPLRFKDLILPTAYILMPALLIAWQPDLGTALLVASSGFFVIFLAGISLRLLGSLAVLAAASFPILWTLLHGYQRKRIMTLLNPESDPLGSGYHIIQSKIAIGSGGLFGKGWLQGTQSHLEFLPERTTDFIFAVFAEEFGFIGILVLFSIYAFIMVRGSLIGVNAKDSFGRLLAGSLILTFFVYIFVNVAMVSGILPVVGVPLPLISQGGTAMMSIMAGFGVVMAIGAQKTLLRK